MAGPENFPLTLEDLKWTYECTRETQYPAKLLVLTNPLNGLVCTEVGLPADASGFRAKHAQRLTEVTAAVDAGYPDNFDLLIAEGQAVLKRRRGKQRRPSA